MLIYLLRDEAIIFSILSGSKWCVHFSNSWKCQCTDAMRRIYLFLNWGKRRTFETAKFFRQLSYFLHFFFCFYCFVFFFFFNFFSLIPHFPVNLPFFYLFIYYILFLMLFEVIFTFLVSIQFPAKKSVLIFLFYYSLHFHDFLSADVSGMK